MKKLNLVLATLALVVSAGPAFAKDCCGKCKKDKDKEKHVTLINQNDGGHDDGHDEDKDKKH